jgi:phage terminase large subunit-like protein
MEVWRGREEFTNLCMVAQRLIDIWKPTHVLIEDTALGPALRENLARLGQNVIPVGTKGKSKAERFQNNLDRFKSHHVILCGGGPWVTSFLDEMVRFPFGDSDQVDALTQLLTWTRENPAKIKEIATNPGRSQQAFARTRNPMRDPRSINRWR